MSDDKKVGGLLKWLLETIVKSLAGIVAVILLVQDYIESHAEYEVNLNYIEETGGELVYENNEMLPDAFLLIQGQVVIKSKDNVMIKTFIIDGMYKYGVRIEGNKKFVIESMKCPLADRWIEKLRTEVVEQLIISGEAQDEIIIEKIGLVCIDIWSKDQETWLPFYYILEGNVLTKLDEDTAKKKMNGVKVTEELLEESNAALVDQVMKETLEQVEKEIN